MPFYKVWCPEGQKKAYHIGQERTPEGAMIVFNANDGWKLGVELTMLETDKPCTDYLLVEQEKEFSGQLSEGRRMSLYHK